MSEQAIDEFLDLLSLTTEEARAIKIMLWFGRPATYDEILDQYKKRHDIKIGNKMYHILNNLSKKKLVVKIARFGVKDYCIHHGNLETSIKKSVREELLRAQLRFEKVQSMEKISLTTHVGEDKVAELFKEVDRLEAEGVEQYGITDILSYPVKTTEPKNKLIKEKLNAQKHLLKLRKQGKMRDYHISEKSKVEEHLLQLGKDRGKKYLTETINYIIKSLETSNFNIVFADNVAFKFFVIPDKIAVVSWFSSPDKKYLDRALAFSRPDDIKGFEEYFWVEWKRTLGSKSEEDNRKEVIIWAKDFLKKI